MIRGALRIGPELLKFTKDRVGLGFGLSLFCLIVLWPRPSNIPTHSVNSAGGTGEALYKTISTEANFGMLGFHLYETNEGRKHWNIRSRFAELYRKENYSFMKDVDAEFHAERTGNIIKTQSLYGRSMIDKHQVDLEGNVTVRSAKGYLFEMRTLTYDGNTHEFRTKDPVDMKGPDPENPTMLLHGIGLVGHIDREQFLLKEKVFAQRRLKRDGNWLKINSNEGEFFTDEQRAVFLGNVQTVLPSTEINSDLFELSTSEDREFLQARGNVTLKQEKRKRSGKADKAYLEIDSNKIILEGRALLNSKGNLITGRRITLYTEQEKISVEQAEGNVVEEK